MLLTFLFATAFFISTSVCDDANAEHSPESTEGLLGSSKENSPEELDEVDSGITTTTRTSATQGPQDVGDGKPEKPLTRQNAIRRPKKNEKKSDKKSLETGPKPSKTNKIKDMLKKGAGKAKQGAMGTVGLAKKTGKAAGKKLKGLVDKTNGKFTKKEKDDARHKLLAE